ncbi:unnamed protein product [Tilletia controversa]|uniref:Uncharacterized protein n=2 Tax=Tilletia TaxID=13289 RepID=A0A9N8Q7U4_9BASI|nr:hypothetical protein CF336_g9078 [Tilletia laevis]KAE8181491.1 hypothetical protein CF328_g8821 [Tilletia controversa]CAD6893846.1 unnamed protein product [Tilletia caries]CAD6899198.1 unnamed protein product [Tilletia laevis]CAD6904916.1 unnamed protein product [Tilletia caries]
MNISIIALFCGLFAASIVAANDGDRGFHPHEEDQELLLRGRYPHDDSSAAITKCMDVECYSNDHRWAIDEWFQGSCYG